MRFSLGIYGVSWSVKENKTVGLCLYYISVPLAFTIIENDFAGYSLVNQFLFRETPAQDSLLEA
jgi:hypothetical protein